MNTDMIVTVGAIVVICYLVGAVAKASGKVDKWIPCIVGTAGGILGVVGLHFMPDFPAHDILNAIAIGIASGLASTGVNQIVKQLSNNE